MNLRNVLSLFRSKPVADVRVPVVPQVNVVLAGPPDSGKSATMDFVPLAASMLPLASDLRLGIADPRLLAEANARTRQAIRELRAGGRHTTVTAGATTLSVFDGGQERLTMKIRDAVGQVLTHTTTTSPAAEQAAHAAYLNRLARADVWWMVIPTPPNRHTADDEQLLYQDAETLLAHARAALALREPGRPVAAAVLVSKIDARYASREEARERLPREFGLWLARQFRSLATDPNVGDVSIFPVSALGFGTTTERPARPSDGLARGERVFVLKPRATPKPWNLQPLLVWTALAALGHQPVDELGKEALPALVELGRRLRSDLTALRGWRGRVAGG